MWISEDGKLIHPDDKQYPVDGVYYLGVYSSFNRIYRNGSKFPDYLINLLFFNNELIL